jgi:asparagine synthase (glutamine-hydrolysing)
LDEPFGDSSAINVYILSRETRRHATVALSGDGADELLGGYNKHLALNRLLAPGFRENMVSSLLPLWNSLRASRNNKLANKIRQLKRFAEGSRLAPRDRYWRWAGYADDQQVRELLSDNARRALDQSRINNMKARILDVMSEQPNMNEVLLADMKLVLPNDMLTKVDLMSMAHGLEVRTPFLDYELVNYCFSLPSSFKVAGNSRKRILQDAFRNFLPPKLYNRPKKGFEVPLLKWFRREMKSMIVDDLLSEKMISDQKIFDYVAIEKLKKQLFSNSPGDVHARIWALIVFQWWWRKNISPSTTSK